LRDQADAGDAFSQLRMGERYAKGDGVEKDEVKAREYLTKASVQGNEDAKELLSKLTATASASK
jgi:TPR repeat protein